MIMPQGFLWKLTLLNTVVITLAMGLTGWAIYEAACNLVGGIGNPSDLRQTYFSATLFHYFLIFTGLGVLISTIIHYYLTKKMIHPIRELIISTKSLAKGTYPAPIDEQSSGEIAELIVQYNALIEQLERNEKERQKLVENISHELRTPTANIKGYLYALKEGDISGDKQLFDSLHNQAEQLTSLIEQVEHLHEWSVANEQNIYEKEIVNSEQLINESIQLFDWRIEQSTITVEKSIEPIDLIIYKDGMQRALSNIIENAIRYRVNDSPLNIVGKNTFDSYVIEISSEGESIDDHDRERIFERFYRVDHSRNRATGGTGLGLAIAKEIVTNHGGAIELKSNGNFHTFTIFIPKEKE